MSEEATLTFSKGLDHESHHEILRDYEATHGTGGHGVTEAVKGYIMLRSTAVGTATKPEIPDLKDDTGVYYINFTPDIASQYRPELIALKSNIDDFRSWATYRANKMIERKIATKQLNQNNISEVSSYRAKAFNVIYGQKNDVLNVKQAANNYDKLEVRDKEFHANILKVALAGFSLATGQIQVLDNIITSIVDSLKQSESYHLVRRQYFILAITYTFDQMTRDISAQMRTISFESTNETHEVAKNKSHSRYIRVEVGFSGFDYDFNLRKWLERKEQLKDEISAGADDMRDDPEQDVPV